MDTPKTDEYWRVKSGLKEYTPFFILQELKDGFYFKGCGEGPITMCPNDYWVEWYRENYPVRVYPTFTGYKYE